MSYIKWRPVDCMTFKFLNNLFIPMWSALEHTDTNRWLGRPRLTTYIYFPIDLSALSLQNLACSVLINFPLICLGFCAQQNSKLFLLRFQENYKSNRLYKAGGAEITFSNFSCMFLKPNNWETYRNKLKKHSVTKNCSDLSLFE